jgi:hypothetical protein
LSFASISKSEEALGRQQNLDQLAVDALVDAPCVSP